MNVVKDGMFRTIDLASLHMPKGFDVFGNSFAISDPSDALFTKLIDFAEEQLVDSDGLADDAAEAVHEHLVSRHAYFETQIENTREMYRQVGKEVRIVQCNILHPVMPMLKGNKIIGHCQIFMNAMSVCLDDSSYDMKISDLILILNPEKTKWAKCHVR